MLEGQNDRDSNDVCYKLFRGKKKKNKWNETKYIQPFWHTCWNCINWILTSIWNLVWFFILFVVFWCHRINNRQEKHFTKTNIREQRMKENKKKSYTWLHWSLWSLLKIAICILNRSTPKQKRQNNKNVDFFFFLGSDTHIIRIGFVQSMIIKRFIQIFSVFKIDQTTTATTKIPNEIWINDWSLKIN